MNGKKGITSQSIENLKGEIEFRAKLARQHVSGEVLLSDYYNQEEHDRILLERVQTTYQKMKELEALRINFSPFLELGAERGQRSLVLANNFGANGVAIDISYHQLKTMEHFSRLSQREKLPIRICCDANQLPFRNNSFSFIFCYEFLHHFPSLAPIVKEIYRVLSGGYFYFDEEPFKRVLKVALYKQKYKIYSEVTLRKHKYFRLIESFFSDPWCDEEEHGILENNNISLAEWSDSLSIFEEYNADLVSIYNISSKLSGRVSLPNALNYLLGGSIAGLCRKNIRLDGNIDADISALLGCPNCTIPSDNGSFDRPPLVKLSDGYRCPKCGFEYPTRDGIIFLLPKDEFRQLYPEFLPDTDKD